MDEKFYDIQPESSHIPGPAPDQRHAQPSGPWPWQDIEALGKKDVEVLPPLPLDAPKWQGYPQVSDRRNCNCTGQAAQPCSVRLSKLDT